MTGGACSESQLPGNLGRDVLTTSPTKTALAFLNAVECFGRYTQLQPRAAGGTNMKPVKARTAMT